MGIIYAESRDIEGWDCMLGPILVPSSDTGLGLFGIGLLEASWIHWPWAADFQDLCSGLMRTSVLNNCQRIGINGSGFMLGPLAGLGVLNLTSPNPEQPQTPNPEPSSNLSLATLNPKP